MHKFCNNFNSLLFGALNNKKQNNEIIVTGLNVKENFIRDSSHVSQFFLVKKLMKF